MKKLFLIPARGGSKGIPGKNTKLLNGKPLIYYSIDVARKLASDDDICVTTDDDKIIEMVESYGLKVPFVRPAELALDTSGTYETIVHALKFYEGQNKFYDVVVLLQPTSPFRKAEHVKEALALYSSDIDMVVSVSESRANPYYTLFEEDKNGFLFKSKEGIYNRRQDCPKVWEYNGAVYIMNAKSLMVKRIDEFKKVKKYVMDEMHSLDLDTPLDWKVAEYLIKEMKL